MYTLFLDTHGELLTISFIKDKDVFTKQKESDQGHAVLLLPLIDEMIKEKNITLNDFNNIVVVNGPGSFTGLRIGLTVAKTIAYCLNMKVTPICTLEAYGVSNDSLKDKLIVLEDNNGYYYMIMDKDNNIIKEAEYTDLLDIDSDKYDLVKNDLDVLKIIEYSKKLSEINPHTLKANYIKKIEVEK